MKISSSGSTAARRSTLAPLSRVPDSESRSSSSTPVSTARSHACLRATRQWAMRSPQGAARPTSTGDGRLIRRGAASGKFSSISSTASLLVVRRTHGSGVRPLGPGAAVGVPPAAGSGSAARDEVPRRGGRETPRRAGPGRVAPARPGRDPARTRCAASRRSPARFRATDSDATQTKPQHRHVQQPWQTTHVPALLARQKATDDQCAAGSDIELGGRAAHAQRGSARRFRLVSPNSPRLRSVNGSRRCGRCAA